MGFVQLRNQVNTPDSLAQVVASLVRLKSAQRKGAMDHILVVCTRGSRPKTYFIAGSNKPGNNHSVHITGSMDKALRSERKNESLNVTYYTGPNPVQVKCYDWQETLIAVNDIIEYIDKGKPSKPISKGQT